MCLILWRIFTFPYLYWQSFIVIYCYVEWMFHNLPKYSSIIVHLGFSFLLQKPLWLILRKLSPNKWVEYNCWVKENEKFKLDPGCLLIVLFNLNPLQLNLPHLHKNNILKCALFFNLWAMPSMIIDYLIILYSQMSHCHHLFLEGNM